MTWQEIIPQILLATVAALPGIYAIWRGRHREKAEVAKIITEAAGELIKEYKEQLDSLERLVAQQQEEIRCLEFQSNHQAEKIKQQEKELEKAKERVTALEVERGRILTGAKVLAEQIRKLDLAPIWEPEG